MYSLINLFIVSFYRAIVSVRFFLSVVGVAFVVFIASSGQVGGSPDVLYLLDLGLMGSGSFIMVLCVFPIIPFATTFASEWEEHATGFWIVRSGTRNYAVIKFLVSILSGMLTTGVGLALFVIIMSIWHPLFIASTTGNVYEVYLQADKPEKYLLFYITHMSLSSAIFAAVAVWMSAWIPNIYTTAAAPIVLYFFFLRISTMPIWPKSFNLAAIIQGVSGKGSPLEVLLTKLGIVTFLCILIGYGTVVQIHKRIQK